MILKFLVIFSASNIIGLNLFFFFFPPPVDLNQQLGKERNKTKLKDKACSGY